MTQGQGEEGIAEQFEKVHLHLDYVDRTLQDITQQIEDEIDDTMNDVGVNISYDIDQGSVEAQIGLQQVVARLNRRLDPPFFVQLNDNHKIVVGDIRREIDADLSFDTGSITAADTRERKKAIKQLISSLEESYEEGAPKEQVLTLLQHAGLATEDAEDDLEQLKQKGEVYEPSTDPPHHLNRSQGSGWSYWS